MEYFNAINGRKNRIEDVDKFAVLRQMNSQMSRECSKSKTRQGLPYPAPKVHVYRFDLEK